MSDPCLLVFEIMEIQLWDKKHPVACRFGSVVKAMCRIPKLLQRFCQRDALETSLFTMLCPTTLIQQGILKTNELF